MNEQDGFKFLENFKWPENITERQKEDWKESFRQMAEEKARLCVIYTPNCGCLIQQFVVLDRYPMSPKILSRCPECKKGCFMEISDPIVFYDPTRRLDISMEDLKNSVVTPSSQEWLIKKYQESSLRNE